MDKKYFTVFLLIILSLFHIRYGLIPSWNNINSDFPNYYTSSRLLLERTDLSRIYNDKWFQEQIYKFGINEGGKFSPFPPPTVFVMIPVSKFSPLTAKRIFLVFNNILLLATAYIFMKISPFSYIFCLNITLLSGAALLNTLLFGQLYLLLLFVTVLGYYYLMKEKEFSAGILWGIGAVIKYFPFILIPVLIIKRKWRALGIIILTVILINFASLLILGKEVYTQFFSKVLFSHLNGNLSGQSDFAVEFQSWNSMLRRLFIFNPVENRNPLINSPFLFETLRGFIYMLFIGTTILVLIKIKSDRNYYAYSASLLTTLLLVLSPASATYHLMLLSFSLILMLSRNNKSDQDIYNILFMTVYILIAFLPFFVFKLPISRSNVLPSYYHLWLLTIFFMLSVSFIMKSDRSPDSF